MRIESGIHILMKVLVTGTSSGLGYGIARAYLEDGAEVYGIARRSSPVLENYHSYYHLEGDLTEHKKIPGYMQSLLQAVDKIDLVFLNAGMLGEIKDMQLTELTDLKQVMDVNLWSNKSLLDTLLQGPVAVKHIIAISSGAAVNGNRGWSGYAISKAALNMMIQLYAQETPDTHFSSLAPGLIDTSMQDYIFEVPDENRYESVKRLREARGTEAMPGPEKAGELVKETVPRLASAESGAFLDIRSM